MKLTYETPKLVVHGTVEEMTHAFGSSSAQDTVYLGGSPFGYSNGSTDGDVFPKKP